VNEESPAFADTQVELAKESIDKLYALGLINGKSATSNERRA
jgi:hypothetical protein